MVVIKIFRFMVTGILGRLNWLDFSRRGYILNARIVTRFVGLEYECLSL